jgi:hypothetical protein
MNINELRENNYSLTSNSRFESTARQKDHLDNLLFAFVPGQQELHVAPI